MEIEINTKIKVSETNKHLFDVVANSISCGSKECVQTVMSKRAKDDMKSFVTNALYMYFGKSQAHIADGAVSLLEEAITSEVIIHE